MIFSKDISACISQSYNTIQEEGMQYKGKLIQPQHFLTTFHICICF